MTYTDKDSFVGLNRWMFSRIVDVIKTILASVLLVSIGKPWSFFLAIILNATVIKTTVFIINFYAKMFKYLKELHIKLSDMDRYFGIGVYMINTEELEERVKEFESQEKHAS